MIILQSFLEGYNATVFAYGQTGSGKSFTMQEDPDHIGVDRSTFIIVVLYHHVSRVKKKSSFSPPKIFVHKIHYLNLKLSLGWLFSSGFRSVPMSNYSYS